MGVGLVEPASWPVSVQSDNGGQRELGTEVLVSPGPDPFLCGMDRLALVQRDPKLDRDFGVSSGRVWSLTLERARHT